MIVVRVTPAPRVREAVASRSNRAPSHPTCEELPLREQAIKTLGFLKTTAVGGLVFLLPLAVIGALLGYVFNTVLLIYEPLKAYLPVSSPVGLTMLFLVAVAILVVLCFACGLAAQRAIGRKFSQTIESHLITVFPKYAIYKDILAGNVGGGDLAPSLTPVTVQFDDAIRVGYEADRTAQGLVVVYLPGSPDPWIGSVALVKAEQVSRLEVDFGEASAICERLGRQSKEFLSYVVFRNNPTSSGPAASTAAPRTRESQEHQGDR